MRNRFETQGIAGKIERSDLSIKKNNMQNYSQTQASNIATLVGFLVLILNHFHINIASDEISTVIGGIISVGGILWNWYHRYSKGDLTIAGVRKL